MAPKKRLLLTLFIVLFTLIALLNIADQVADISLNESIEQGVVAFASVRTIHAIISMLEGTEFTVPFLTVSVGEVLSPAAEILQTTSTVLTTALASLGLQKILLDLFATKLVSMIVAISAITYLITLWSDKLARFICFTQPTFIMLCLSRFLIVGTLLLNSAVDHLFLNDQTQELTQETDFIAADLSKFNQSLLDGQLNTESKDEGFIDSAKRTWNSVTSGFEQTKQEMEHSFEQLQQKTEDLVVNLLTLMAMFTLKTILIPIGFLLMLKQAYWSLVKKVTTT
jgi:hypothetical protein